MADPSAAAGRLQPGGLAGATLATRLGNRVGAGNAILLGRVLNPAAWILVAVAPEPDGRASLATLALVGIGQFVVGFSMGIENPNEMGVPAGRHPGRSARTDERLDAIHRPQHGRRRRDRRRDPRRRARYRAAIWIGLGVFVVAAVAVAASPLRTARHGEQPPHAGPQG